MNRINPRYLDIVKDQHALHSDRWHRTQAKIVSRLAAGVVSDGLWIPRSKILLQLPQDNICDAQDPVSLRLHIFQRLAISYTSSAIKALESSERRKTSPINKIRQTLK